MFRFFPGDQAASINYEIKPSTSNGPNDKFKINILTTTLSANNSLSNNVPLTVNEKTWQWPKNENIKHLLTNQLSVQNCQTNGMKVEKISINCELKQISVEIDKRLKKKINKILGLLQDIINSKIPRLDFVSRMHEIANITVSDLIFIAKKLLKKHKFALNPNSKDFAKIKSLNFPTSASDLSKFLTFKT